MIAIQALTGIHPMQWEESPETQEIFWENYYQPAHTPLAQGLMPILSRMIQADPTRRYPSADAVLQDLHPLLRGTILRSATPRDGVSVQVAVAVSDGFPDDTPDQTTAIAVSSPACTAIAPLPEPTAIVSAPLTPSLQRTLLESLTRFSSPIAAGLALTLTVAVGGYTLLNRVDWANRDQYLLKTATQEYQAGNLEQAVRLAASIPDQSPEYETARSAIARWQEEWQTAVTQLQTAEQALQAGNWQAVIQAAQTMPAIDHWKQKIAPLVAQATEKAEADAIRRLQDAYQQARAKDFTAALANLKQITPGTSVYFLAQNKLREYTEKQQIRATAMLQQAFNRAAIGDFTGALLYVKQIPQGTTAWAIARQKQPEYTEKQRLQVESLLRTAASQANREDFASAVVSLSKVPSDTPLDAQVQAKLFEYTERLNWRAERLLQQATDQATAGNFTAAIADLQTVPIGTPAYLQAREKLLEYTEKEQLRATGDRGTSSPDPVRYNLNPGSYWQEIPALYPLQNKM